MNRTGPDALVAFAGVIGLLALSDASALSPAPYRPPGIELIQQGACAEYARSLKTWTAGDVTHLAYALSSLEPGKWLPCLDALPPAMQLEFLLDSARRDERLLQTWYARGGDLNSIRTEKENLMGIAASMGRTSTMQWLRDRNLRPLDANDEANELVVAAAGRFDSMPTTVEWLIANGYRWPERPELVHRMVQSIANSGKDDMLQAAAVQLRQRQLMPALLAYDRNEAGKPLIFSARSARAVRLMYEWGVDVQARQVDRKTGEVTLPSALFNGSLDSDAFNALLDLGVSPKGRFNGHSTPLMRAVATDPRNFNLIERYLNAGVEVDDPAIDPIPAAAMLSTREISPPLLQELIQLLVRHGANPRFMEPETGDFPIHTVISEGDSAFRTAFLSVWLTESHQTPSLRHPKTNASLVAFALQQKELKEDDVIRTVVELARLGAPMRLADESLVCDALFGARGLRPALLAKVVELGADVNAVDVKTGDTALGMLVEERSKIYICIERCTNTHDQALELARELIRLGADPEHSSESGISAALQAKLHGDTEMMALFKARESRAR